MNTAHKMGRDLAIGDTIVFLGKGYRVTRFEDYDGLPEIFIDGARIAHVEGYGAFMTVDNSGRVTVAR